MPLRQLVLRPGINTQLSPTLEEGGWSEGNLVRFPYGVPQPVGGWLRYSQTLVLGLARALHAWSQLNGVVNLTVATHAGLFLFQSGALYDQTPVRATVNVPANSLSTVVGSPIVTISLANHGFAVGDLIVLQPGVAVGGLTLGTFYVVVAASSSLGTFQIKAAANATATVHGGGPSFVEQALLPTGNPDALFGNGWGAGGWGGGTYGTPRQVIVAAGGPRLWSLDNWGEQLIACPRGGSIYNWQPANGPATRATPVPNAPTAVFVILVGMPERHLIAFGCNAGGVFDPMLVAWCDVENYTVWGATATNSAGSFRLAAGNSIVGRLAVAQEILIWTESNVYAMRFVGLPYVYSFNLMEAEHTGLIAQNAAVTAGTGNVFWMGINCFWSYSGTAVQLECTVWDRVFQDLNYQQKDKIVAGSNAGFSEVWWMYPSAGSVENDSIVIYNYRNQCWSKGKMARTAWLDRGVLVYPIAAAPNGMLYNHELGPDADGAPLLASVTTGFIDVSDGDEIMEMHQVVPDFSDQTGNVSLTVEAKKWPDDPVATTKGPFTVTAATRFISPRLRGRQLALTIASAGVGCFWRLGKMRARIAPSGRQ